MKRKFPLAWARKYLRFRDMSPTDWNIYIHTRLLNRAYKSEQDDKKPRRCNVCGHFGVIK